MGLSFPRRTSSIVFLVLLMMLLALAGCSGDEEPPTTSEAVTSTSGMGTGGETTSTPGGTTQTTEAPGGTGTSGGTGTTTGSGGGGAGSVNYQEQLPDLEAAVEEEPENLEALQELAIGYYQTQQYEKAEETYQNMIEIEDSAVFHNNLGNVYRDWGKTDEAISEYERAIEIDPSLVLAYSNLATMYFTSNRLDEAREVLEQGIENASGPAREQLETLLDTLQ